jgi:hypothetical protein
MSTWPDMTNKQNKVLLSLEIATVVLAVDFPGSFCCWEPKCGPGKFEVMLDDMKLQDLVIAACTLINS